MFAGLGDALRGYDPNEMPFGDWVLLLARNTAQGFDAGRAPLAASA